MSDTATATRCPVMNEATQGHETRRISGTSLVWPIVLIGMGVVFLLDNLNVIDVDLWLLITRLWPLVLVAVGIDILFDGLRHCCSF